MELNSKASIPGMKILHIDLGNDMRGGQWQVLYLTSFLSRHSEFPPVVACPKNAPLGQKLRDHGIEVIDLPSAGRWNPISITRLLWARRKQRFALIHTHDARSAALGAMLRRLWGKQVKLIHTRRVSYPVKRSSLGKYRLADRIVGVSQDIVNSLVYCGLPEEKLQAIHSGIDLSRYTCRQPGAAQHFVFAMVGAFTPQKGHNVLLKAMALLNERGSLRTALPPWEVRMIGSGPLFESVLAKARELGVDAHLAMLGQQDAGKILPYCDAMLVPSVDGEGSSGAIKEAWAVGLPLICSDLPANLELAIPENNCLTFASGQEAALAEAMHRLLLNPGLCERLVNGGKASVTRFTAEKMAAAYVSLYQELLTEAPTS